MPTYDYICTDCRHEFEAFQRMSEDPLSDCPECGASSLKRKIGTGAGIIFKGGGFYETDFKDKKGSKSESKPSSSENKSGASGGESKSSSSADTSGSAKPAASTKSDGA